MPNVLQYLDDGMDVMCSCGYVTSACKQGTIGCSCLSILCTFWFEGREVRGGTHLGGKGVRFWEGAWPTGEGNLCECVTPAYMITLEKKSFKLNFIQVWYVDHSCCVQESHGGRSLFEVNSGQSIEIRKLHCFNCA